MEDGVQTTPEQAARSFMIVRLVSFGVSAALAAIVLLAIAALRFSPLWRQEDGPRIVVSELAREPEVQPQPRALPPTSPPRAPEAQQTLSPTSTPEPQQEIRASEPVTVTDPVWVTRPRNPERFYPREAFMQGLAGQVVLDCDVDVEGRLSCAVASETPPDQGFGDAALRIANAHVMQPAMRNGAPTRARYRMVVPFSPSG
ncbi:MAG: TonB family protein [Hyphomonadaceae bacterium]